MKSTTNDRVTLSRSAGSAIYSATKVELSSDWRRYRHVMFNTSSSYMTIDLAYSKGGYTQSTPISIDVRQVKFEQLTAEPFVEIPPSLTLQRDLRLNGSTINLSDQRVKNEVQTVSPEKCMQILTSVDAKVYRRIDMDTAQSRVGFLAQDLQQAMTNADLDVSNIVMQGQSLLGLDYSRLVSILWSVCKQQEERIQALEAKN